MNHERFAKHVEDTVHGRLILSPAKFIQIMGVDVDSFASNAHVPLCTVMHAPATESIQSHIRMSLQVLAAMTALADSEVEAAVFWYRNEALVPFDYRTAETLVAEGRSIDVLNFLDSFRAGFVG